MKILSRYVGSHVVWNTLLALAVLLALFTLVAFVDDLKSIGKGHYGVGSALEYMLLTMPSRAFDVFPVAALIGSLMGLGTLAANAELTVARASGVSVTQIAMAVAKAALVLTAVVIVLGEVVAPQSDRLAQERRSLALSQQIMLSRNGFWVRDGANFINVRKVLPDNHMVDVYVYQLDDAHRLREATYAHNAIYRDGKWLLKDVQETTVGEDGVNNTTTDVSERARLFAPELVALVTVTPERLSALGLYGYIEYLRSNSLSTDRYRAALWHKIIYPIATVVMIFLAIPLVLGRLLAVGVGQRILAGTLVGIAYHVLQETSMHMGLVFGLNPALSVVAPTMLFLGLALWLMKGVR